MKNLLIATLLLGTSAAVHADDALVKKGQYLARAGDCVACHTAKGGKPFAGGLAMQTPIGTVYSTNITPEDMAALKADAEYWIEHMPKESTVNKALEYDMG
ncbi:MAG: hypothetical protein ABS956_22055, partial [Pseudomonas sp.]